MRMCIMSVLDSEYASNYIHMYSTIIMSWLRNFGSIAAGWGGETSTRSEQVRVVAGWATQRRTNSAVRSLPMIR